MKAVRVNFDDDLLARLDETADVREKGRSAVLRQITSDFLQRRRRQVATGSHQEVRWAPKQRRYLENLGLRVDLAVLASEDMWR